MIKAWWIWTQLWSMATNMGVWTPVIHASDPSQEVRLFKLKSKWYIWMMREELNRKWIFPGQRLGEFWLHCKSWELGSWHAMTPCCCHCLIRIIRDNLWLLESRKIWLWSGMRYLYWLHWYSVIHCDLLHCPVLTPNINLIESFLVQWNGYW